MYVRHVGVKENDRYTSEINIFLPLFAVAGIVLHAGFLTGEELENCI